MGNDNGTILVVQTRAQHHREQQQQQEDDEITAASRAEPTTLQQLGTDVHVKSITESYLSSTPAQAATLFGESKGYKRARSDSKPE